MRLVEQWRRIEAELVADRLVAQLALIVPEESQRARAAALLGPLGPGRVGPSVRFAVARGGEGAGTEAVRRLLRLLDREGVEGELELLSIEPLEPAAETARTTLAEGWHRAVSALPADWSDVYAELQLDSTDYLDRGALLLSPVNPARFGPKPGFRFRVARRFGYGASAPIAMRCLERLDAERITGSVRVVVALSGTKPVATQGPVWYIGGRAV